MASWIGRNALLTGLSLAAITSAPALAQTASEEIVVTATGREASLQSVPLAVSALSAEELKNAGVTDLRQVEQIAPSYRFFTGQSTTAGTTAYIRGIGTGGDNPGFESAVGFFIDGVYRNRSGVALGDLPEVRRIEVLRGPQGTLFGRNTSAGAVSVVTAGPEYEASLKGQITGGAHKLVHGDLSLNGPIVADKVAARFDIAGRKSEGYIEDVISHRHINDADRASARAQVLWDITPLASLRVIVDGARSAEECCAGLTVVAGPTSLVLNSLVPGAVLTPDIEARRLAITPGRSYREGVEEAGISGQLDWDLGNGMNFTSITAYRDWGAKRAQDIDFSAVDRAYRDGYRVSFKTGSQEFRLHGRAGIIDWLGGLYYSKEKLNLTDRVRFGSQAGLYTDAVTSANTGGAQLLGTLGPMTMANLLTPGFRPNAVGLAYLQTVTGQSNPQLALGAGAANPTFRATYDAIANAFLASAPTAGTGQVADVWSTDTQDFALFTHNQIEITDALTLTLGVRYNQEEKTLASNLNSNLATCGVIRSPSILPIVNGVIAGLPAATALFTLACNPALNTLQNGAYSDKISDSAWSGLASAAFQLSPDAMAYVSYSRGFKAGGFNLDRSSFSVLPNTTVQRTTDDLRFKPEMVDAYEIGLKTTNILPNTTLNGTLFYEDISDFQLNEFAGFNFQTRNIPAVVSKGVEIEAMSRPVDHLTLSGGILYNEAFFNSAVVFPAETLPAGTRLRQAPKWTFTGAGTVDFPLGQNFDGLVYIDARHVTDYPTQTLNRNPATDNKAYTIFNLRVGVKNHHGWGLEGFVHNLSDETYFVGGLNVPEQTGTWGVYPNAPRAWGVTLRGEF